MANQLGMLNQFVLIHQQSGAIANDATPTSALAESERCYAEGARKIACYWTATGETGTVTLVAWAWDAQNAKFVQTDSVATVAPNVAVELIMHGGIGTVTFAATAGASGSSNAKIYGIASPNV